MIQLINLCPLKKKSQYVMVALIYSTSWRIAWITLSIVSRTGVCTSSWSSIGVLSQQLQMADVLIFSDKHNTEGSVSLPLLVIKTMHDFQQSTNYSAKRVRQMIRGIVSGPFFEKRELKGVAITSTFKTSTRINFAYYLQ